MFSFDNLITPFFCYMAAPAATYYHSLKTYKPAMYANDPLEQWARERGFATERYDGNNVLTYPLLFAETWAGLWAATVEAPRLVPLDWALTNTELVEVGSTFINLHYGIRPVVEKRPERVFHGGQNIQELPEISEEEPSALWYKDCLTAPSLPVALGDFIAHPTWQNEECRQTLLHLLHDRMNRNH